MPERIKSFTIGMPAPNDEAVYAKEIAAHLCSDHIERYIDVDDAKAVIPLLAGMYGEPFADSSQIPTYLVSKLAGEHVATALGGDGGDELFCGYGSYSSVERIYRKLRRVPYFIRYPVSRLLLSGLIPLNRDNRVRANLLGINSAAHLYINSKEYDKVLREISLTDTVIPYKYNELDPHFLAEPNHQLMLMNLLMYHPDDNQVKVDRAATAASLMTASPLLDKDVVEFAFRLPIESKRNNLVGKTILRDILYRYVPRELMERPKQGFSIPIDKWLKEPALRAWAEQLIARDTLLRQGILNPDIVHRLWQDFMVNGHFSTTIWHILMFQEFLKEEETRW
jgi:asparagine synthase (glutamine-hydrolysing)